MQRAYIFYNNWKAEQEAQKLKPTPAELEQIEQLEHDTLNAYNIFFTIFNTILLIIITISIRRL